MDKGTEELKALRDLLKIERNYERQEYDLEDKRVSLDRLVKRGAAWWPLRIGRSYYNSLNQYIVEVYRLQDADIDPAFECGKAVRFFETDGAKGRKLFQFAATVSFVDGDRMAIALPSAGCASMLMHASGLGVQIYLDETSYKLMFDALGFAIRAESGRMAELRRILHGQAEAAWAAVRPLSFPWLNASQAEAVNKVLAAKDVAIVHGPPGTGKTTTLVEAIGETLRRESQVLVCAQSNMAVDWICELLVNCGIGVLRIGNPSRVTDAMLEHTFERRFAAHPDYHQLWSIRSALRQLRKAKNRDRSAHQKIAKLSERAVELEIRINSELLDGARVIASTLTGSASKILDGRKFSTLFIDEAAQAMEPACWIAIQKADRVIFAGDHLQLPPTVKSPVAFRGGLAKSLMEVAVEAQPVAVSLLTMQYRMNDAIMRFSSDWFYGGKLTSAPDVMQREGVLGFEEPVEWLDTSDVDSGEDYAEEFIGESFGRVNKAEAKLLISRMKSFILGIGLQRFIDERIDVGIISPYRMQVRLLRSMVAGDAFFRPFRGLVSINTVDGFQGQERDVIVLSMVRSNQEGEIGFLNDLRRMNVAITRARHKLIIVGDTKTLGRCAFYRKLVEYVNSLNL